MISQTSEYESLHSIIHHLLLHHFLLVLTFYCSKEIKSMVVRWIKNVECYSTRTNTSNLQVVLFHKNQHPHCYKQEPCLHEDMQNCWHGVMLGIKKCPPCHHSKSPFMVHILTSFTIPCLYFHKLSPMVNYCSFLEFSMIKDYFAMF